MYLTAEYLRKVRKHYSNIMLRVLEFDEDTFMLGAVTYRIYMASQPENPAGACLMPRFPRAVG